MGLFGKKDESDVERIARLEAQISTLLALPCIRNDLERVAQEERTAARGREDAATEAAAHAARAEELRAAVERSPWVIVRLAPGQSAFETRPGRHKKSFVVNLRTGPLFVPMRRTEIDERLAYDESLRRALADGTLLVETVPTNDALRLEADARRSL